MASCSHDHSDGSSHDHHHHHHDELPPIEYPVMKVDQTMYTENRARLLARMRACAEVNQKSIAVLVGGKQLQAYDTDKDILFRQESNFQYVFGVDDADFMGAIDIQSGRSMIFIPRLPAEYAVWMGELFPPEHYAKKYQVDSAHYIDEMEAIFTQIRPEVIYHMKDADFPGRNAFSTDVTRLQLELIESRVIKSAKEMEVLRYAAAVSSAGHVEVMRRCRPGMFEYQLESIFLHDCYYKGACRQQAYVCICGAGKSGATLHYPNNDKRVLNGQMCLLDMGSEYNCYCSDITCSFPSNGKFTQAQREIYQTVLEAQIAVEEAMRPGVDWTDMHRLAERVIIEGLKKFDYVRGELEELISNHIPALFFPHGLGHFLGLDTHDVGGYTAGMERIQEPGIRNLRTRRVLAKDMVLTVEPGIYFIDALLGPAMADEKISKYLNAEKLVAMKDFGGVRLEDDVIVTASGIENMTRVPRTIEDVEHVMAGGSWPRE